MEKKNRVRAMLLLEDATSLIMSLRVKSMIEPVNEAELHKAEMMIFKAMDQISVFGPQESKGSLEDKE